MRDRANAGVSVVLAATLLLASAPRALAASDPVDEEIRKVVDGYARAIQTKDVNLFRTLKPNLRGEEEQRLARAFASVRSQVVTITVQSIEVQGEQAVVRVSRHDVLDGSIVSSFPQTLRLAHGHQGWSIQEIGRQGRSNQPVVSVVE